MNGDEPSQGPYLPRQQTLTFVRNTIGPGLPKVTYREIQDLLAQMLADVVRKESEPRSRGGGYEREDP